MERVDRQHNIYHSRPERHVAHVRAHAMVRDAGMRLEQAANGQVMVDVHGAAVQSTPGHLVRRPREIRAKIDQALARPQIEVPDKEVERRRRRSDIAEVTRFGVIPRGVAVGQREDGVLQRSFRP